MSSEHMPREDWLHTEWIRSSAITGKPMSGATFDNWHAAEIAAAEQRGAIKALRDAANLSRACWAANKNLVDPNDPEASYSFDRWLEVRADQMEGDDGNV